MTEINFKDFKEQILTLRQKVWEQTDLTHMTQVFVNGFYDEHDESAFHWGFFDNSNKLIASARLTKHLSLETLPDHHLLTDISELNIMLPIGSLNRLCVDKKLQGQGLSEKLDKLRITKAKEIGCKSICVMTYGHRGLKLLHDGFKEYSLLTLSKNFKTDKENAKELPPAFYYKSL